MAATWPALGGMIADLNSFSKEETGIKGGCAFFYVLVLQFTYYYVHFTGEKK